MRSRVRWFDVAAILIAGLATVSSAQTTRPASGEFNLRDILSHPDASYKWTSQKRSVPTGWAYDIKMQSQVWHEASWGHDIWLRIPENSPASDLCVIYFASIAGGQTLEKTAANTGLASAVLSNVPGPFPPEINKPGSDLMRDATSQYARTGDRTWVPIYPMTVAAVRAMDTIQAATKDTPTPIKRFVLIGHSKLGYTAWMTAAIDPRVAGIVPMAAQVLNTREQVKIGGLSSHQAISPLLKSDKLQDVLATFDPYSYRDRLTMPKLDIAGVKDSLYAAGAMTAYLDKLPGPSYALALPNVGHGVPAETDTANATQAFLRALAQNRKLPTVIGTLTTTPSQCRLRVTSDTAPTLARLWVTTGQTADLRTATWVSSPLANTPQPDAAARTGVTYDASIDPAVKGAFFGVFAELRFDDQGTTYPLTTLVFVIEGK